MDWRAYRGSVALVMAAIIFTVFWAAAPGHADDRRKVIILSGSTITSIWAIKNSTISTARQPSK